MLLLLGELACATVGGSSRELRIRTVETTLKADLTNMTFISEGSIFEDQEMVEDGTVDYQAGTLGLNPMDLDEESTTWTERQAQACRKAMEDIYAREAKDKAQRNKK
jgi:hypothetical protein